jgi:ABC-type multidrug transport system ATPase subunit
MLRKTTPTKTKYRDLFPSELVANPSIVFMDEPTTGLDTGTADLVMRAARNLTDAGKTVVCTIHQPSIDIFQTFDEVVIFY